MDQVLPAPVFSAIGQAIEAVYSLKPLIEPTCFMVPEFVRTAVQGLADSIGFDVETLNMTLGLFLAYPLGLVMQVMPYGKVRHIFSFLLGAFLLQFIVGVQWIHHVASSLVAYAMLAMMPRSVSKNAVPVFAMLYMTAGHLHRQFINYLGWDMDFTGSQMVLTIKLYSLAYNLYDGEHLAAGGTDRASSRCKHLALDKLPGLIEYLGYTFCFANIIAGPAYEYKYYADACDGSLLYDKAGKPKGKIPSNVWPTVAPLLQSILHLGIFVVVGSKFPVLDPDDPQRNIPAFLSEKILAQPWVMRYGYCWLGLFFSRQKYYFAWKNAEGSNNLWYAGFEGFDDKGDAKGWDIASNIDVLKFETAPNLKKLTGAWNKKTANWLGRYVYTRTGGSLVATYGLSAFWHGFYPGYYMFFLTVPLITACERIGRKKISPHFGDSMVYRVLCMVVTTVVVSYAIAPFQMLAFEWSLAVLKNHYFFGHIVCIIFYAVVSQMKTPKKKEA